MQLQFELQKMLIKLEINEIFGSYCALIKSFQERDPSASPHQKLFLTIKDWDTGFIHHNWNAAQRRCILSRQRPNES